MIKYEYKKVKAYDQKKFIENGHTMFEFDVLQRLERLAFLEERMVEGYLVDIKTVDSNFSSLLRMACVKMGVNIEAIKTRCKKRELAEARYIFFYIAHKLTDKTLEEIGSEVDRNHSTVLHGIAKVNDLPKLKEKAEEILKLFY